MKSVSKALTITPKLVFSVLYSILCAPFKFIELLSGGVYVTGLVVSHYS